MKRLISKVMDLVLAIILMLYAIFRTFNAVASDWNLFDVKLLEFGPHDAVVLALAAAYISKKILEEQP